MSLIDLFKIFKKPENRKFHIVLVLSMVAIIVFVFVDVLAPLLVEELKDIKIFSNILLPRFLDLVDSVANFFGGDISFGFSLKTWHLSFLLFALAVVAFLLVRRSNLVNRRPKTTPPEAADIKHPVSTKLPTSMEIDGILWTWKWRDGGSGQEEDILDLKPLCPTHRYTLDYVWESDDIGLENWLSGLHCFKCNKNLMNFTLSDKFGFEDTVRRLIVSDLRTRFSY